MPAPDIISNDIMITGKASFSQTPNLPANSITNTMVTAGSSIDASKLIVHERQTYTFAQASVEPTASTFVVIHIAEAPGTILNFSAVVTGTLPGTTNEVQTNLFRSTAGGAFATVLSSTVLVSSTATLRVKTAGTIASTTYTTGDLLAVNCTLAGTSTTSRGLAVSIRVAEQYA